MALTDCFFCHPERYADRTISQNEYAIAFLSDPRAIDAVVHTLVVPRRHLILPSDLTDDELLDIGRLRRSIQGVLLDGRHGVDVVNKTRPDGVENKVKQSHYHEHVIQVGQQTDRYEGAIDMTPGNFVDLLPEERDRLLGMFAAALA